MPRAIPLTGTNRARRWAAIGALMGLCLLVAGVALNFVPQAQWAGRGILTNVGLLGGASAPRRGAASRRWWNCRRRK